MTDGVIAETTAVGVIVPLVVVAVAALSVVVALACVVFNRRRRPALGLDGRRREDENVARERL